MSFAITIERLECGDAFEQTLRDVLSHEHAARRAQEQDQARAVLFEACAVQGKVDPTLLKRRNAAVDTARASANEYKRHETAANVAEELSKHDNAEIAKAGAAAFVEAERLRREALDTAKAHEATADQLQKDCEAAIPSAWVAHVPDVYDEFIKAGVLSAVIQANALARLGAKAVKVQIGGHVEPTRAQIGFVSTHVWPV